MVRAVSVAFAVGALAPAALAGHREPVTQPPGCGTLGGNVIPGDPVCEDSELRP